ncbi:MAG: nuclease-related domain-containing protein [Nocardioides marinisabuli]|uniref:nuclease-related domain-containing protein n=1 Tax=Nocardioides marinisabuli TaxID=419476 RepID=UPI00321B7AE9
MSQKESRRVAGESARDVAKRQREKAERLMRAAELYERGADGEEATAQALDALPEDQWTVFHDVRWPGRKLANVDHVVVGPGGVFVIDTKNWSGRVEVRDKILRQNGYQRETAVSSAAEAAIAVSLVIPDLSQGLAVPVLCFARDESISGWARDVMVCSTSNIAGMLTSRPPVLDQTTREHICLGLELSLSAARDQVAESKRSSVTVKSGGAVMPPRPGPRSPHRGSPSTKRNRPGSHTPIAWGRPLVVGALLLGLLAAPQAVSSSAQFFAQIFVGLVAPDTSVPQETDRQPTGRELKTPEQGPTQQ